jgi:lipoprotein-anchoring transpeptidase ErfK/SrfK
MRRTLLATLAALLVLAVPAVARAQAPPEPHIAPGVTAAGIDVSNLTLPDAAAKVRAAFAARLAERVTVKVAGRRFTLAPAAVKLKLDANRTAKRAFLAGYAQPRPAVVDVRLYVTYDRHALLLFAKQVAAKVAIAARDARVHIALTHIRRVAAHPGRALDVARLRRLLRAPLIDPAKARTVAARTQAVRPAVATKDLARRYGTVITIDRGTFTLRLFKRLHVVKRYRVAVGMPAYPTPTGLFSITSKAVNPAWTAPDSPWAGAYRNETVAGGSAENPLKARWMGIVNGVGIHGTGIPESVGTAASHGCIRMTVPDVIDLYPRVPVGTPVLIGG